MNIIAYGEDSLTLWALTNRLSEILGKLRDDTPPSKCLIIYRPSFGRRGGKKSSQFGECDAILGTYNHTYLIESKWDASGELKGRLIELRDGQELRHTIFAWYMQRWMKLMPRNWQDFSKLIRDDFRKEFKGKPVPRLNTKLVNNLTFLFRKLEHYSSKTKNILLFLHGPGFNPPSEVRPKSFRIIPVECQYLNEGGYTEL